MTMKRYKINFHNVTKENRTEHNPNRPQIPFIFIHNVNN